MEKGINFLQLPFVQTNTIHSNLQSDQLPGGLIAQLQYRALQRYCKGHGLESRSGLSFFFFVCLFFSGVNFTTVYNCDDPHIFISFSAFQIYDLSNIHLHYSLDSEDGVRSGFGKISVTDNSHFRGALTRMITLHEAVH